MSCFCYLHIFPNEKIYVGSTTQSSPEKRWLNGHGYKKQPLLWNAICKYGWENVRHKVIVCETPEEMWEKEKELIEEYDTTNHDKGYNLSIGGESGSYGYHFSKEARKKMSDARKGKKKNPLTEEHKRKISESAKNRPPVSNETRKKMSESHKGEKHPNYGKTTPDSVRKKISESQKGKKRKPFTESHKHKISEAKKGISQLKYKWLTPSGEIRIMDKSNAGRHHPDWILIQNQ